MRQARHWLLLITSDKEYENVDELTRDIWTHFDGIVAVVHRQGGDSRVADLLRSRQGEGTVIERTFLHHHGHAMNEALFQPCIRPMDCVWLRDSSERLRPTFTAFMKGICKELLHHGVYNVAHTSKVLMFRRWYGQQVVNGLHWGVIGLYGTTIASSQIGWQRGQEELAYSVRDQKRPVTHRYRHEVLYLLDYGLNGNHLALFHPDPQDLARAYERLAEFTDYLSDQGVTGVDQYTEWLRGVHSSAGGIPTRVIHWINPERPFRNHLRFFVLGHSHEDILKDEDTWRMSQ